MKPTMSIPVRMFDRTREVMIVGFGEDTAHRTFLIGMDDELIDYELWDDGVAEQIRRDDTAVRGSFDPALFARAVGRDAS